MGDKELGAQSLLLGDPPSAAIASCAAVVTAALQVALVAAPRVDWSGLAADIGAKIEEMFDIKLIGVMIGAWKDLHELKECADPRKHPPDETISLSLVDHHLDATFKPYLDVAIGTLPPIRVEFEITIGVELRGVTVKVQAAAVRALRLGSCLASATVKCDGTIVFERCARELEVPGEIVLPRAVPIEPPNSA